MFTNPPFPSQGAIANADRGYTGALPPGTTNIHTFSTEPRYTPTPIRFKVRVEANSQNYMDVTLPYLVLPPKGGLFVLPERVQTIDKLPAMSLTYDTATFDHSQSPADTPGFKVSTRNLAEPAYRSNGVQESDCTWVIGNMNTAVFDPTEADFIDENGNRLGLYHYDSSINNSAQLDQGHVFAHDALQFNFYLQVTPLRKPTYLSEFNTNPQVDVTFLLYPNRDWLRLRANNNNLRVA